MHKNKPVVSTAKVRGIIKKNGINYVDATRRMYPAIASGVSVWQLCDSVYFEVFGRGEEEKANINLHLFKQALEAEGLTVKKTSNRSYEIVKVSA